MNAVLGVLFASLVGLMVFPQYVQRMAESNQTIRLSATAQQQKMIYDAALKYIEQNAAALQAVATATNPAIITVPMLQAVKLLDQSFSAVNPYQQSWQIQVLQPTAGYLQALVLSVDGQALNDQQVARISAMVGNVGGFIPRNDSGTFAGGSSNAFGSFGGWNLPASNYKTTGGHPAALLTYANGQVQNNQLYRNAVPGQPQLNQMNTALGMRGNDINGVGTLRGKAAEFSRDSASPCCGPNGQTLALSEDTQNTGRRPSIQFHAAGENEGYIELARTGEGRRLNLRDNQGFGLGLNATGTISGPRLELPIGGNLQAGGLTVESNGEHTALRQPGELYIQKPDGSFGSIHGVRNIYAGGDINTPANSYAGGVATSGHVATGGVTSTNAVNAASFYSTLQSWGVVTRDGAGNNNAQARDAAGSIHVNDIWIRSIGKWASELNTSSSGFKGYSNVGASGYANTDGIMVVMSCYNCDLNVYVNGARRVYDSMRDKYGQGYNSVSVPIMKGESWNITGAQSVGFMSM
jgi:hypothetical protein